MGAGYSLMDTKLNLNFQSREAQKFHYKCLKEEEEERIKVKSAIESRDLEAAKLHASNSLRKRNEAIKYLEFKSKLDLLASQVESAIRTRKVTEDFKKTLPILNKYLKTKQINTVDVLNEFHPVFKDLDVAGTYQDSAMNGGFFNLSSDNEVNMVISRVADEYELDLDEMNKTPGPMKSNSPRF